MTEPPQTLDPGTLDALTVKQPKNGPPRRIEWAVVEDVFRGTHVHKGGLGSRQEAEAWLAALTITLKRSDYERFMATDGITTRGRLSVCWREIDSWHDGDPD